MSFDRRRNAWKMQRQTSEGDEGEACGINRERKRRTFNLLKKIVENQGKMDPHVPRPHVPQNEKLALYSGIF